MTLSKIKEKYPEELSSDEVEILRWKDFMGELSPEDIEIIKKHKIKFWDGIRNEYSKKKY